MPENIASYIVFSKLGLPAISGIGQELEQTFANNESSFDLANPHNR